MILIRLMFLAFSLANLLRAAMACNFSSLIWPHGPAPAALVASLLFDPPEPQIIGKTLWIQTFLPFRAPASSFFWLFLFSDLLSSSLLFSFLTLPTSAFPSVHIVGSLTSKLPSVNQYSMCISNFLQARPSIVASFLSFVDCVNFTGSNPAPSTLQLFNQKDAKWGQGWLGQLKSSPAKVSWDKKKADSKESPSHLVTT